MYSLILIEFKYDLLHNATLFSEYPVQFYFESCS